MFKRKYIIILIFILVVFLSSSFVFNQFVSMHEGNKNATNDSKSVTHEIIANNSAQDGGTVEVIRNMGNPNGEKIAYVVGVHPLENDTHRTFLKLFSQFDNKNYCYDVYIINVTEDFSKYGQLSPDDEPGRATGQDLALKYVYPQIVNGSYKLAVDVHAHGGVYAYDTFVFSPVDGSVGETYGRNVSNHTQNVSYYNPYQTTSGPYLTIPLNQHGVPAFYYEENSYFSQGIKDSHMWELVKAVDNLKL